MAQDSLGYIDAARSLRDAGSAAIATLPAEHSPLYSVFLALGALLGLDIPWFATLVQVGLGTATVVIVARLTARETNNRLAGLCAGVIAAIHISFVFWTPYVLSETLFLFLLACSADRALQLARSNHPARDAVLVALLVIATIGVRPTGISFALAVVVLIVAFGLSNWRSLAPLALGFCLPLAAVGVVAIDVDGARLADWTRSGVQNGLLETDAGRATSGVDIDVNPPPIAQSLPPGQSEEFLQTGPLVFAAHHPEFVLAQLARKLRLFWAPVLPEYSATHAVGSTLYFLALYALAIIGVASQRSLSPFVLLCVTSVILFTMTSLITIVDYDQRYRLPAELFLIPLAGVGVSGLIMKVRARTRGARPSSTSKLVARAQTSKSR
jgi:hypothetical protein